MSFLSPCILPIIPAYFTFITGFSIEELTDGADQKIKRKVILSTAAFVLGFSFVFVMMGASASFLGNVIQEYKNYIRIIGGVVIILLGIHMTGVVRIPYLDFEKRIHLEKKPIHVVGTFLIGMAFAAGWSPCLGPLLVAILAIAGTQETVWKGIWLLSLYSAGLALPFVAISLFINFILVILKQARKALRYIHVTAGVFMIIIGVLLITNRLMPV